MTKKIDAKPRFILLVDDDPSILTTFRFCLEAAGHRIATAETGAKVRELVRRHKFDVCFLDLHLGEISGLDLIPCLRQSSAQMKIIIVTAQQLCRSEGDPSRAVVDGYVIKPCSPEELRLAACK